MFLTVGIILTLVACCGLRADAAPPNLASAYDIRAYHVPAAQAHLLQQALATHTVVRLDAADYTQHGA